MSSRWWTILIAALVVGVSGVQCVTTSYPEIPQHLLECYKNDGIYHRANRLSNSYESFIDLIQMIEQSPTGRNINARELSLVLLHYLKLDGIQSIQSQLRASSNILPFAPSGDEYFKHRLTLIGLIPKIDESYLAAVNESLTQKELCNLHFMLSFSIDPYKRENERCSPLYEDIKYIPDNHGESRFDWNPYQVVSGYHHTLGRNKREKDQVKRRHDGGKGRKHSKKRWETMENVKNDKKIRKKEKRMAEDKKNAELVSLHPLKNQAKRKPEIIEKEKFTVGTQELLGDSEIHPRNLESIVQVRPPRHGGRTPFSRNSYGSIDGSTYSGFIPGMQMSDCPVVNGIITTPSGSLAVGTVMAGIAAGLNPEDIPPTKLSVSPSELENQMDRVNNVWATTLAGTVADTLSSSVLLEMDNLQILKGGWNESTTPKWYLLRNPQSNHLTEVSLRGSLDGLFLGLSAKELTNKFSNFKLSQLLRVYYEQPWGEIGAKNRVVMRPQYAPDEMFRKQVHLMSLVFKRQKTNVLTVLNYNMISRDAVSRISNFIQNLDKPGPGNTPSNRVDIAMNLVAVIDSSWSHEALLKVFESLRASKLAATPHVSNLTIVCGSDGRILMNAANSLDLSRSFTKEMLFQNCTRGMNFLAAFDSLEFFYRKLYKEEETTNRVNVDSQVLIFFPYDIFLQDNQEMIVLRSREFQHTFPDIRLVIAANGRSEAYDLLVKSQTNLFVLVPPTVDPESKSLRDLVEGIKQSFQRIGRPSCGSYFDDDSQGSEVRITKEIYPGEIAYFRLLPQYFFNSHGDVVITIRSKQRAPLTVCHSRDVEKPEDVKRKSGVPDRTPNPDYNRNRNYNPEHLYGKQMEGDSDGPVQCKTITGETYRIEMNYPCYTAYSLAECQPLYISIQPPEQPISIICHNCKMPFNVQSEISVVGLTCYNAAVPILLNPFTLILSFFALLTRLLDFST